MAGVDGPPRTVRVRAGSLDDQGAGVGLCRLGRRQVRVHVAGLLPGEEADVRLLHCSPHRPEAWAALRRRASAAPERVVPVCPAFGRCGGCALQHLAYPAQLRWKAARLAEALTAAGATPGEVVCVASPQDGLGQRSRAKLVAARQQGRLVLGAYAPRSHQVVDLTGCRVVTPLLRGLARSVARAAVHLSAFDEGAAAGQLRYVLLRDTADGQAQVSLVFAEVPPAPVLDRLADEVCTSEPAVSSVTLHENPRPGDVILDAAGAWADRVLRGTAALWERLDLPSGPLHLRASPRSFLQVNRAVAARLYADAAAALRPRPDDVLLDLYCGVGGLGLAVAAIAPGLRVLGVDEAPSSIADAEAAALRAGARARYLCGDAAGVLAAIGGAGTSPTLCTLNPPRRGCAPEVLERVAALAPRALAYVSCDPASLARDLRLLLAHGYRPASASAYDMHPHTPHVEALLVLERAER